MQQENQKKSTTFLVDASNLKTKSRKPKYLKERRALRTEMDFIAPKESNNQHTEKRSLFVQNKQTKLRIRHEYIQMIRNNQKNAQLSKQTNQFETIQNKLIKANKNRSKIFEKRVKKFQKDTQDMQKLQDKSANERRKAVLEIPRSKRFEQSELSTEEMYLLKTVELESCLLIQRCYRNSGIRSVMKMLKKTNLTLEIASKMNFKDLALLMKSELVMNAGESLMKKITKLLPSSIKIKQPFRVFLSSYMIATHPKEIMPSFGPLEMQVQASATEMILSLESMFINFDLSNSNSSMTSFITKLTNYYKLFETWKEEDMLKISDGMIAHWLELERLWLSVRYTQADAETEWFPKIEQQQQAILKRLTNLGKVYVENLNSEIQKMRNEIGVEITETLENDSTAFSTSPRQFPLPKNQKQVDSVVKTKTRSSSGNKQGTLEPLETSVKELLPKVETSPITSVDKINGNFGEYLSNERLAHELVRDPDFKLHKNQDPNSLEERVRTMAKKAFFDKVREEFNQGIYINYAPNLLLEIKNQLLGMVSEKGSISSEIKENMDIELIQQQIQHNVFNPQSTIEYIVSKMLQLCAPVRDQPIRDLVKLAPDFVAIMQKSIEILEEMKMDLINYKLKSLAIILKDQAVEYEHAKFEIALKEGRIQLNNTKTWLFNAKKSIEFTLSTRNPEQFDHPENKARFEDIFNEGVMNLLTSSASISKETIPETFLLDAERMFGFQNELQTITVISALIMLSKNVVPQLRNDFQATKELRDRLFVLLKSSDVSLGGIVAEIISQLNLVLAKSKGELTEELKQLIKGMVERTISTKDTVYSLLSRRIQTCIRGQLNTGKFKSITGMSLTSAGLDMIEKELTDLSRRISLLALHNKKVHYQWYDSILEA